MAPNPADDIVTVEVGQVWEERHPRSDHRRILVTGLTVKRDPWKVTHNAARCVPADDQDGRPVVIQIRNLQRRFRLVDNPHP